MPWFRLNGGIYMHHDKDGTEHVHRANDPATNTFQSAQELDRLFNRPGMIPQFQRLREDEQLSPEALAARQAQQEAMRTTQAAAPSAPAHEPTPTLEAMTVEQLKQMALEEELPLEKLGKNPSKAELIRLLKGGVPAGK